MDEEAVSTLVAITSKPRELCIQALQMTQGNADVACSLLLEGLSSEDLIAMAQRGPGGAGAQPDDGMDYGEEDMSPEQMAQLL